MSSAAVGAPEAPIPPGAPGIGSGIPGWGLTVAFGVLSAGGCWMLLTNVAWLIVGLALTVVALRFPRAMLAWLIVLLFGVSMFWQQPDPANWRFYVLLAAAHLLHILGGVLLWLSPGSRVQLAVLGRMGRRFLAIQIPVQLFSWLVLSLSSGVGGATGLTLPALGLIAGIALALTTLVLMVPMFRRPRGR